MVCQKSFVPENRGNAKTCSAECRKARKNEQERCRTRAAVKPRKPKPCLQCRKPFVPVRKIVTCSPECRQLRKCEQSRKRNQTPEAKAVKKAWEQSAAGRAFNREACARYRKTENGKKVRKVSSNRYSRSPKGMAKAARNQRRYYQERKAKGMCTYGGCGKKPKSGRTLCRAHLLKLRKDNHTRKAKTA